MAEAMGFEPMPEPCPPLQATETGGCVHGLLCKSFPERSHDFEEQLGHSTPISNFAFLGRAIGKK